MACDRSQCKRFILARAVRRFAGIRQPCKYRALSAASTPVHRTPHNHHHLRRIRSFCIADTPIKSRRIHQDQKDSRPSADHRYSLATRTARKRAFRNSTDMLPHRSSCPLRGAPRYHARRPRGAPSLAGPPSPANRSGRRPPLRRFSWRSLLSSCVRVFGFSINLSAPSSTAARRAITSQSK